MNKRDYFKCKFISNGTWFKKGTEVKLIDDYGNDSGLFEGTRVVENEAAEVKPVGYIKECDQEVCSFTEFDIYDDDKLIKGCSIR